MDFSGTNSINMKPIFTAGYPFQGKIFKFILSFFFFLKEPFDLDDFERFDLDIFEPSDLNDFEPSDFNDFEPSDLNCAYSLIWPI